MRPACTTHVEVVSRPGRFERVLRFGRAIDRRGIEVGGHVLTFPPRAVLALQDCRWSEDGAVADRIAILQCVRQGEAFTTFPQVSPGAEILLDLRGQAKVSLVLEAIGAVEAAGLYPADVAPDHWRVAGSRIAVGLTARRYEKAQHRAWRLRRSLGL